MKEKLLENSESHKKVRIPERIKAMINPESFKNKVNVKVVRGLAIGQAMLVFLTGCSGIEEYKNEKATANPNAYTEKMDELKTSSQEELEKLTEEDGYEGYESYNEMDYKKPDNRICTYDALINELNQKLEQKDFSKDINEMYKQLLDNIYQNYAEWETVSLGMPNKYEYIRTNLIDVIDDIDNIYGYVIGTKEADDFIDQGGYTSADHKDLYLIYVEKNSTTNKFVLANLQDLLHENQHLKQRKILFNTEYFGEDGLLHNIITEGGATYHMRTANELRVTANSSNYTEKGNRQIIANVESGGYGFYGQIYEKLCLFAGYQTMENVTNGEGLDCMKKSLVQKYGKELTMELIESLCEFEKAQGESNHYDQTMNLENIFLKFLEKDINDLDNKEDIQKYMEVYRRYKSWLIPQIIDSQDNKDYTNEVFNLDKYDNIMISKIEQYSAIQKFSSNEKLNRIAIKAILNANQREYEANDIYDSLNTPKNISNSKYRYEEKDECGYLYIEYENQFTKDIRQMEIIFDENGYRSIKEANSYRKESELLFLLQDERDLNNYER